MSGRALEAERDAAILARDDHFRNARRLARRLAASDAEILRLRRHLGEIGLAAGLSAQLSDPDEREPWEMIAKRVDDALAISQQMASGADCSEGLTEDGAGC